WALIWAMYDCPVLRRVLGALGLRGYIRRPSLKPALAQAASSSLGFGSAPLRPNVISLRSSASAMSLTPLIVPKAVISLSCSAWEVLGPRPETTYLCTAVLRTGGGVGGLLARAHVACRRFHDTPPQTFPLLGANPGRRTLR